MKNILILILIIGCAEKKTEPKVLSKVLDKEWTLLDTKDSISDLLVESLKEVTKTEFRIANLSEKFSVTDFILNSSISIRQLKFLSKKITYGESLICKVVWANTTFKLLTRDI